MPKPKTYIHRTGAMKARHAGGDYSTARGPFVEGERLIFGKITIPAGTRAELHSHPNEQFSYVIQGRIRMEIAGRKFTAGPGDIIHIPPGTKHSATVVGEEDHVFITCKDASWGIHGVKAGAAGKKAAARKPARKAARTSARQAAAGAAKRKAAKRPAKKKAKRAAGKKAAR